MIIPIVETRLVSKKTFILRKRIITVLKLNYVIDKKDIQYNGNVWISFYIILHFYLSDKLMFVSMQFHFFLQFFYVYIR